MTHIIIYKNSSNGEIVGFNCEGHSGYSDAGSDIVCSAVSTLTINTINSIEEFTDDCFNVSVDEESATIDFIAASYDLSLKAQVLLDACNLGLTGISNNYPDYLSITIKEV